MLQVTFHPILPISGLLGVGVWASAMTEYGLGAPSTECLNRANVHFQFTLRKQKHQYELNINPSNGS